jgi:hypothetical protein
MTTTHPSPTLFAVPRNVIAALPWEPVPGSPDVTHKVVYTTGTTVAGLLRLAPGAREVPHLHVDGEHHLWVIAGTVYIDDTELTADSYIHVPGRLRHTLSDGGAGSLVFYVFCPSEY